MNVYVNVACTVKVLKWSIRLEKLKQYEIEMERLFSQNVLCDKSKYSMDPRQAPKWVRLSQDTCKMSICTRTDIPILLHREHQVEEVEKRYSNGIVTYVYIQSCMYKSQSGWLIRIDCFIDRFTVQQARGYNTICHLEGVVKYSWCPVDLIL